MRLFAACLLLSLLASQSTAQSGQPIQVVLPGKGWSVIGGPEPLARGSRIPTNAIVKGTNKDSLDLVLDCSKDGWLSYTCKDSSCQFTACKKPESTTKSEPFTVERVDPVVRADTPSASEPGFFASLFKREPSAIAVLGVREGGHPNDAVIRQTGAEIHLAPALNRVLEGKYCFRFTALPAGKGTSQTAAMDWDRSVDPEGVLQAPNLKPGLYVIEKSSSEANGACTFEPESTPPWVLIVPDSDFTKLEPLWKDYSTQVHTIERSGASPTVLLTVRHAVLAYLADPTREK